MYSLISSGIQVSVETFYQPDHSVPSRSEFVFAYRVTIENKNDFPVRLLSRYWLINDSNGDRREVEGEGVVGVQPVILPGKHYQYISACHLQSEMGRMSGEYLMQNIHTHQHFKCEIPAFFMEAPSKLN